MASLSDNAAEPWVSITVCWAAPRPGVLVTAPESTPTISLNLMEPSAKKMANATAMLRTMMSAASPLSSKPPCLNDEKNDGPTWSPMENRNKMSPNC